MLAQNIRLTALGSSVFLFAPYYHHVDMKSLIQKDRHSVWRITGASDLSRRFSLCRWSGLQRKRRSSVAASPKAGGRRGSP